MLWRFRENLSNITDRKIVRCSCEQDGAQCDECRHRLLLPFIFSKANLTSYNHILSRVASIIGNICNFANIFWESRIYLTSGCKIFVLINTNRHLLSSIMGYDRDDYNNGLPVMKKKHVFFFRRAYFLYSLKYGLTESSSQHCCKYPG